MPLKRKGMTAVALAATGLTLTAQANESILVRDVRVHTLAFAAENITFSIDQKKVANYVAASGINLLIEQKQDNVTSILAKFREAGMLPTYPVSSGRSFIISGCPANSYIEVIYDLYDDGDIRDDLPNGFSSRTYDLMTTISNATTLATAGDIPLDRSDIDAAFPAFPGGDEVPAKMSCSLLAIAGTAIGKGTGAANGEFTQRLKFVHNREELFDKSLGGMLHHGDNVGVTAGLLYGTLYGRLVSPAIGKPAEIIVLDDPIKFDAGDELNIIATIGRTGAGADFVAGDIKLHLFLRYQKE